MSEGPVLVLGGRSDIGLAVAHRFASQGRAVQLAARNAQTLETDRADIALRHNVAVTLHEFDALDLGAHVGFVEALTPQPDVVVCAVGMLGDQAGSETDLDAAVAVMRSNYEGPATILAAFANRFEANGAGTLVGISSVAGDRGRASNYVYGSAKAGFTAFLSGLRNRLARKGVHVVTVLPGFVATRMTAGMDLPARLTATPEQVAAAIETAVNRKRDVVYVKPIWALVMLIIRHLPEAIFKRAKI
jgi:decaprenylphospho-beta-D-erythro-pentofuranosid-2-ulose 2-reductase